MPSRCPRCDDERSSVRHDYGREKILRCAGCELCYLHPWPSPEDSEPIYDHVPPWKAGLLDEGNPSIFGHADYIYERLSSQPQLARVAREIRTYLLPSERPPRLMEIGCGFGFFLAEAFEEGFSVSGIEFNRRALERLKRKYAFPVQTGSLESIELGKGAFDAVAMFQVVEHLRDPFAFLDRIYEALAPGGLLVVSTSDAESLVSRIMAKPLEAFRRTREHLFFFTRRSLKELLDDHGFEVLETRSIGYSLRLAFLLDRLAVFNRPLFSAARKAVEKVGLGSVQLRLNPGTKMIAFARRRGSREAPALTNGQGSVASLDRTMITELRKLEATGWRHYRWVFDTIAPHLGRSVLEVGSGIGVISKFLLPRCEALVLSDYREVYLEELRRRFGTLPHVHYQLLDLTKQPFEAPPVELDTILCVNVLEHIEDDGAALDGLARLLPRGGRLILQVPNYPSLYGSLDESYGHYRRYDPGGLRRVLERSGFRVTALRKFSPFSIPGWILSTRVMRSRRLSTKALRLNNALVPAMRFLDFASHFAGLSLFARAEKR